LEAEDDSRPVTTSQRWKLIKPESCGSVEVIGRSRATPEQIHAIAAEYGASVIEFMMRDVGPVQGGLRFIRPDWDEQTARAFAERLQSTPLPTRITWRLSIAGQVIYSVSDAMRPLAHPE
jgi:hypothetical protein